MTVRERERECSFSLNLTASCAFNEWRGERMEGDKTRQDCLCCSPAREGERAQQIYVSQEVPQICGVTLPPAPRLSCVLWLLINSQFKFPCVRA